MPGIGILELIIIVIAVAILAAAVVGLIAAIRWAVGNKKDTPSDAPEEKEKRKKRIVLAIAGYSAGCIAAFFVISILAAIALPALIHSRAIKNKQSEAQATLMWIYTAEGKFHRINDRYSADPSEIGFTPATPLQYYQWKITYADEERFEAGAWGNIDEDPTIDIWVVTEQAGEPVNTVNDVRR